VIHDTRAFILAVESFSLHVAAVNEASDLYMRANGNVQKDSTLDVNQRRVFFTPVTVEYELKSFSEMKRLVPQASSRANSSR
jgi:hypothetical protein